MLTFVIFITEPLCVREIEDEEMEICGGKMNTDIEEYDEVIIVNQFYEV